MTATADYHVASLLPGFIFSSIHQPSMVDYNCTSSEPLLFSRSDVLQVMRDPISHSTAVYDQDPIAYKLQFSISLGRSPIPARVLEAMLESVSGAGKRP